MANPYRRIWDHNGADLSKAMLTLPDDLLQNLEDAPGRQIMARCSAIAAGRAMTFPDLFAAFTEVQFTQHWAWRPNAGGWDHYGLLDGTKVAGECQHFARNLLFLARAPAPYGLGLGAGAVSVGQSYKGSSNNGFVAVHNGIFLGLRSNVAPAPNYAGPPLYVWENHKTVQWNGRFWDPCYVTSYAPESAMAAYQSTNVTVRTDADGLWNPVDPTTASKFLEGKTAEKATRNGRIYYFRRVAATENRGAHIAYEGPIDETRLEIMRSTGRLRVR